MTDPILAPVAAPYSALTGGAPAVPNTAATPPATPTAPASPAAPTPVSYADLVNNSGTIRNTKTSFDYNNPDQLAQAMGLANKSQIDWSKIALPNTTSNIQAGPSGTVVNGNTGGVVTPPPAPATPTPAVPSLDTPEYQALVDSVTKGFQLSPDEEANQQGIDNLQSGLAISKQLTGNQPIAIDFITGQKKAQEDRELALEQPLLKKAALLQAKRQAGLDASKFALDEYKGKITAAEKKNKDSAEYVKAMNDRLKDLGVTSKFYTLGGSNQVYDSTQLDPTTGMPKAINFVEYKAAGGKGVPGAAFPDVQSVSGQAATDLSKFPTSYQEYILAQQGGYNGSYNDYQNMDANRKAVRSSTTNIINDTTKQFDLDIKQAPATVAKLAAKGMGWGDIAKSFQDENIDPGLPEIDDALHRQFTSADDYAKWKLLNKK